MSNTKHTPGKLSRVKVGESYYRSGYNRTAARKANIYLIEGFYYAKDSQTSRSSFYPLEGKLSGYVRVNLIRGSNPFFIEISNHTERDRHITAIKKATE